MYDKLKLEDIHGNKLLINKKYLEKDMISLNEYVNAIPSFNKFSFVKRSMFEQEIKTNNEIEGLNDSILDIQNVIENKEAKTKKEIRILNLYKGYLYILKHKEINKESLRELYNILSNNLLCDYDINHMGKYYREGMVFISDGISVKNGNYVGMDYKKLPYYMDMYFDFEKSKYLEDSKIDNFVKSQIMHYYFVFLHPYFDVNGRTSRTLSMWKLLNNKNYPYIIFNRAIINNKSKYFKVIVDCRKRGDVTLFIKYMIDNVRITLEREEVIESIVNNSEYHITKEDQEIINYILLLNGSLTLKDLESEYNRHNIHKNRNRIFLENIEPLIDKNIILVKNKTKNKDNYFFKLNDDLVSLDRSKIKELKLNRYL